MEDNEIALSYNSICLRKNDIKCFEEYNQLNDMAIGFYYEYLSQKSDYKDIIDKVALVHPASASLIIYDYDIEDLIEMFEPMNFNEKEIIFFPINDNIDKYNYAAGNHWALLIYKKSDKSFYYLDSMLSYMKTIDIFVKRITSIMNSKTENIFAISPKIINLMTDKLQTNSYDCGMFVLSFTESVLSYFLKDEKINLVAIEEHLNSNLNQLGIKFLRKEILKIISNLKKVNPSI